MRTRASCYLLSLASAILVLTGAIGEAGEEAAPVQASPITGGCFFSASQFAQFPGAPGLPGGPLGGGIRQNQQPGILPGRGGAILAPGQSARLALLCTDLFAATPGSRTRMAPHDDRGRVFLADGAAEISLRDAIEREWLEIRGRQMGDPPRLAGRAGYDVFVSNRSQEPLRLDLPEGLLLVPAGQAPPRLPAAIDAVLASAAATRQPEGDASAYAVWGARGFTRADVEQTTMRLVTSGEVRQVQRWLDAAALLTRFDRDEEEYERLYTSATDRLSGGVPITGIASLATGGTAHVSGVRHADGRAVVTLSLPRGGVFRYAARVDGARRGTLGFSLLHLKTGEPLEANGGHIWVTPVGTITLAATPR